MKIFYAELLSQMVEPQHTQYMYKHVQYLFLAGHFTSEIYKIEIGQIPKVIGYGELKRFLHRVHKVKAHKIKYLNRIQKAYVTFNR